MKSLFRPKLFGLAFFRLFFFYIYLTLVITFYIQFLQQNFYAK